jgi:hypothetical protein
MVTGVVAAVVVVAVLWAVRAGPGANGPWVIGATIVVVVGWGGPVPAVRRPIQRGRDLVAAGVLAERLAGRGARRAPGRPSATIAGIGASMLWWEEGFCRMLADNRRFVIRYDHRDTGRSVTYEPGRPG